ncbi:MAG: hypothetical protein ABJ327_05985 [Litoreibacter sp.]
MDVEKRAFIVADKLATHRLQTEDSAQFSIIFDFLPNVMFYVKDHTRRWMTCNQAALNLLRRQDHSEIIGAREKEFFLRRSRRRSKKKTFVSSNSARISSNGLS